MNKLPKKPNCPQEKLYSWDDLASILKTNFSCDVPKSIRTATINLDDYDLSKEEIVNELEKAGYSYDINDPHITIT